MPVAFAVTAGLLAGLAVLGFVGISRSEESETRHLPPPPFMRRLAQERRIRHEVDLLARMQEGLLPQEMPRLGGVRGRRPLGARQRGRRGSLRLPARRRRDGSGSPPATWPATATPARWPRRWSRRALLSLVEPTESPAGVLRQLDRVLRGANMDHSFTSLALIRLDPATGDGSVRQRRPPLPADRGVRPGDGGRAPRAPPRPRSGAPLRRPRVPAAAGRRPRLLLRRPLRGAGPQRQRLWLRPRPRGAEGDGAPAGRARSSMPCSTTAEGTSAPSRRRTM